MHSVRPLALLGLRTLDPTGMNRGCCWQIRNLDTHNGEGLCICEVDQDKNLKEDRDGERIIHPGCPVFGHSDGVHRVNPKP